MSKKEKASKDEETPKLGKAAEKVDKAAEKKPPEQAEDK